MAGTEGLECPDLHLSESLSAELCLTSERLLCDEAVRADASSVHLVFHHVSELEHVCYSHRCELVELLARGAVVELCGAVAGQTCLVGPFAEVVERSTVEDGRSKLHA